ncbi:MAG: pilus assembly protein [Anaerolineae bacterium]|nr:pilus assembly protein [Anaerolineae bacterium]
MKRLRIFPSKTGQRGQSLVEVALFFPIFIIMLAGVVEISNIIITQNRVTSATRASARFGADGGQDEGMTNVLLNTVTQTLELDQEVWDVWVVRGTVNEDGNAIESWQFNHVYGISNTQQYSTVNELEIQEMVLEELQRDENGNQQAGIAADIEFVGTYALHDIDSILGLNALPQFATITSVRDLSVMRVLGFGLNATDGCSGFPIVVYEGERSVTPGLYEAVVTNSPNFWPQPAPAYVTFYNHRPNVPLRGFGQNGEVVSEGDIFLVQNGGGQGGFGWLVWNQYISADANTLEGSLTWPGNSTDYTTVATGGQQPPNPPFPHRVYGYIDYNDPTDTSMNIGDWVMSNTGAVVSNDVREVLEGHITAGRQLRLIVYEPYAGTGSNARYQITGFAVFRLLGYQLSNNGGQGSYILAEFIRWDDSCGQVPTGP